MNLQASCIRAVEKPTLRLGEGGRRLGRSLNGFDILTLRLLVCAAEEGNLARVSERHNIATSAVSRRISDFEARYGVQMFDRHDRGVLPSPDGAQMLQRIRTILDQLEAVADELLERRDGAAGLVRIQSNMSSSISASLPMRIAEFRRAHPRIEVELDECTSIDIVSAVSSGACEIGVVSGNVDARGLELIPWQEDELVAVLPQDLPLAQKPELCFADLLDHPFISVRRDGALTNLFRTQAAAIDRTLHSCAYMMSFGGVRSCVRAGLGVSILPANTAYPFAREEALEVRKLSDPWARRSLKLCVRNNGRMTSPARLFVQHLIRHSELAQAEPRIRLLAC
ncbi:LysR substrate-binding domain-containing protein [Sandaracinobacteroides hominis]|uniref:LysR substrate-binding domain-containing protein n=1 Tax=Sandaracinobacteroides hominis TaxID=2780086 RepID=UPI0018F3D6F9|nr:LysR substrate-binding domain-containing protein [Sandaracinobacteroides hominis]